MPLPLSPMLSSSTPCFYEGVSRSPTQYHLIALACPYTGESRLHRTKGFT